MSAEAARLRARLPDWILTDENDLDVDMAARGSVSVRRPDGRMFVMRAPVLTLLRELKRASEADLDRVLRDHGLDPDEGTYHRLEKLASKLNDDRARLEAPGFVARRSVVSPTAAARIGHHLLPLLHRRVAIPGLLLLVVLDALTLTRIDLGSVGIGVAWISIPALVLAAAFHEMGHAAALVRGGGRPGTIGLGIYLIWPVFYADTTESWFLTRRQRMLVDVAGVYYQLMAANVLLVVGLVGHAVEWQVAGLLVQLATIVNFNPLFRYDGHWLLADALGVTDLYRAGRAAWSGRPLGVGPGARVILRGFWLLAVVFWPVVLGGAIVSFGWQTVDLATTGRLGGSTVSWPPSQVLVNYVVTAWVLAISAYRVAGLAIRRLRAGESEDLLDPSEAGGEDTPGLTRRVA